MISSRDPRNSKNRLIRPTKKDSLFLITELLHYLSEIREQKRDIFSTISENTIENRAKPNNPSIQLQTESPKVEKFYKAKNEIFFDENFSDRNNVFSIVSNSNLVDFRVARQKRFLR